jgi:uncharacterized protein (DUF488 family)
MQLRYNPHVAEYHVYTIGHGQETWDEFVLRLRPHNIEVLIDVRSDPYTYHALGTSWFDRDRIEQLSRRQGWEYLWLGAKIGALTKKGLVDNLVREQEEGYRAGIRELLDIAGDRTICLLGGHSDPFNSHVHTLISQTLLRHHVGVIHILPNGATAPAQADLFHAAF